MRCSKIMKGPRERERELVVQGGSSQVVNCVSLIRQSQLTAGLGAGFAYLMENMRESSSLKLICLKLGKKRSLSGITLMPGMRLRCVLPLKQMVSSARTRGKFARRSSSRSMRYWVL